MRLRPGPAAGLAGSCVLRLIAGVGELAALRSSLQPAGQTGHGVGVGVLIWRIRADTFIVLALLHRHCAGQRLIAQHARKGSAAFVKIGVPGVAAVTQQVAEGEG